MGCGYVSVILTGMGQRPSCDLALGLISHSRSAACRARSAFYIVCAKFQSHPYSVFRTRGSGRETSGWRMKLRSRIFRLPEGRYCCFHNPVGGRDPQ